MFRKSKKWFVCVNCGHAAKPENPYEKCSCPKCLEMTRVANRCRTSEELRNRPDLPARL